MADRTLAAAEVRDKRLKRQPLDPSDSYHAIAIREFLREEGQRAFGIEIAPGTEQYVFGLLRRKEPRARAISYFPQYSKSDGRAGALSVEFPGVIIPKISGSGNLTLWSGLYTEDFVTDHERAKEYRAEYSAQIPPITFGSEIWADKAQYAVNEGEELLLGEQGWHRNRQTGILTPIGRLLNRFGALTPSSEDGAVLNVTQVAEPNIDGLMGQIKIYRFLKVSSPSRGSTSTSGVINENGFLVCAEAGDNFRAAASFSYTGSTFRGKDNVRIFVDLCESDHFPQLFPSIFSAIIRQGITFAEAPIDDAERGGMGWTVGMDYFAHTLNPQIHGVLKSIGGTARKVDGSDVLMYPFEINLRDIKNEEGYTLKPSFPKKPGGLVELVRPNKSQFRDSSERPHGATRVYSPDC